MDSKYQLINNSHSSNNNHSNGNGTFNAKRKFPLKLDNDNNNNGNSNNGTSTNGNGTNNKKAKASDLKDSGISLTNGESSTCSTSSSKISIMTQKAKLPVYNVRAKLVEQIIEKNTLIIIGETGSGKTTQIPQFLHEAGFTANGLIGVTQPRRVAAITIAKRVSQELFCKLGELVGYTVRFEDTTTDKTKIKYMTDGSLLREALSDRLLKNYRVIILDEAHERTINTDILFGIVKEAQRIRELKKMTPLKIILMSATMDVDHFSEYFNKCEVIYLQGRAYHVKVNHTIRPQNVYLNTTLSTIFQIHKEAPPNHDILVFLTGQDEIESLTYQIRTLAKSNEFNEIAIRVFPLFAALPHHQQLEVFLPSVVGSRKIVLSTNIAETSITISGIKYVIDCGKVKMRDFDSNTGMETLKSVPISKAQAWQRTGRAGRDSEGNCYRTYTQDDYNKLPEQTKPEILRCNIASVALQLLALGIDCEKFDFMDIPPDNAIEAALKELKSLGAITSVQMPGLTVLGRRMSKFPLSPRYSKILLSAQEFDCLDEMLSLIAVLSGESIFVIPNDKREEAIEAHRKFHSQYGDHLTLLKVFKAYQECDKVNVWCYKNYFNAKNLNYAKDVRRQLQDICERLQLPIKSCGDNVDQVRKCLLTGLFNNVAHLQRDQTAYLTLTSRQQAKIHPSSILNGKAKPEYVLFTELVATRQIYMRTLTTIEPEWIREVAPQCTYLNRLNLN